MEELYFKNIGTVTCESQTTLTPTLFLGDYLYTCFCGVLRCIPSATKYITEIVKSIDWKANIQNNHSDQKLIRRCTMTFFTNGSLKCSWNPFTGFRGAEDRCSLSSYTTEIEKAIVQNMKP